MNETSERPRLNKKAVLIFIGTALYVFFLMISQISLRRSSYELKIGDVAPQDITAPRTVTYISDILTQEAKSAAEENVSDVYLPADPTISRTQVQNLRYTFQFLTTVRSDTYSSEPQKFSDIDNISLTRFDETTIGEILSLVPEDWATLQEESLRVLENVMQNSIREDQVVAETEGIPAMVDYFIKPGISSLVNVFVSRFVTANSLYSEELTQKNREAASEAVQPRERTFVINQTIVQRGQVITDLIYEALDNMGMVTTKTDPWKMGSVLCMVLGASAMFIVFFRPKQMTDSKWLMIAILFAVYLTIGRLITPNHTIMPYFFPVSAFALTVSVLFGQSSAFVLSVILCVLLPYDFSNAAVFMVYYLVTSLSAIKILGKERQINNFLTAGLLSSLIGIPAILAFQLLSTTYTPDLVGLLTLCGAAIASGLLSAALALISQYIFAGLIGITTPIRLMEILRPDSPLLQRLLQTAPGTYQHSLQVANLAEQAARDIGADSLLTRAGAMVHDIGKTMNPHFFVENQVAGNLDTHDDLSPKDAAAIIIRHTTDGVELIRKYKLPDSMADFVRQHHGTNQTRFQLTQAIQQQGEENVDLADFTYPGPRPQSKETALVMLADTTEARARAERPSNDEEIRALVKSVFDIYNTSNQLNDTPLTLHDLDIAMESFIRVLRNIYHPRVRYPEAESVKRKK